MDINFLVTDGGHLLYIHRAIRAMGSIEIINNQILRNHIQLTNLFIFIMSCE